MFDQKGSNGKYISKDAMPEGTPEFMKKEISKHRYIKVKLIDEIKLYFARHLGPLVSGCCFKRKENFIKMYDRGKDRIDAELNIVKIMRTLRDLKILMKNSLMDEETRY